MAIFDRLLARSAELARGRVAELSDQLAKLELPSGVFAERIDGGISVSGKRLRRRIIDDVRLLSFADLVKGRRYYIWHTQKQFRVIKALRMSRYVGQIDVGFWNT